MATQAPRILLVDDEHAVQKLLAFPLRKDGYEVVGATTGSDDEILSPSTLGDDMLFLETDQWQRTTPAGVHHGGIESRSG